MAVRITPQSYPRIEDETDKFHGFIDDTALKQHTKKIPKTGLRKIIRQAIITANAKSSRAILEIPENASVAEKKAIHIKEGNELFKYFKKYPGDPASTAFECLGRHYSKIGAENFRNRTLQKERMNSGWRYQYIAKDAAIKSKRFISVSDIGATEADFNAIIGQGKQKGTVTIYVSVKNRVNTMGGQDWPKAIYALEQMARSDKNRTGPYICVFGIAMDQGQRNIKGNASTNRPHSINTEVWLSDFFWPFFANYSYEEIIKLVLGVLQEIEESSGLGIVIPKELLDSFGKACKENKLLDKQGRFNDAEKLVDLFCGKL